MVRALKDCGRCGGSGLVERSRQAGDPWVQETCPPCGGSGKVTDWGGGPEKTPNRPSGGFLADQISVGKE